MAKKKTDDAEKGGGGKLKKLGVPLVALVIGVVVGPKFLGSAGSGEAAAQATTTTTAPGPIVALDPITLNLADGHLLKVGIALQQSAEWLAEHAAAGGGGGHGGGEEETDTRERFAPALDAAITVFSSRTMDELLQAPGREEARAQLSGHLLEAFHGEIESVYLYEFVMQ